MFRLIFVAALTFFTAHSANATLIIEGNFAAIFTDVPDLSGSFSASFDDSALTGVGFESFNNQQILTALTLTPNPFMGVTFDTTNTGLGLVFNNGLLIDLRVGGLSDINNPLEFSGDWLVAYGRSAFINAAVGNMGVFTTSTGGSGSYTFASAAVPAPATFALFGLGLAGLGWSRRKKA